jgi:hypothetical protein
VTPITLGPFRATRQALDAPFAPPNRECGFDFLLDGTGAQTIETYLAWQRINELHASRFGARAFLAGKVNLSTSASIALCGVGP